MRQYKLEVHSEHNGNKNILVMDIRKANIKLFDQSSPKHKQEIINHINRFIDKVQIFRDELQKEVNEKNAKTKQK